MILPSLMLALFGAASSEEPDRLKVLVMEVAAAEDTAGDIGRALTGVIAKTLDQTGAFEVISTPEIQEMLELKKAEQMAGCDVACLAEIGGAFGVDFLITPRVTALEGKYLLQLELLRISPPAVIERVQREYAGPSEGLLEDIEVATRLLVRDVLAERSGALRLHSSEEGATVRIDAVIVGVTPLESPLELAEGTHTLDVEKEGFVRFQKDVDIKRDETAAVDARLRPSQAFIDDYEEEAANYRLAGWSLIGVGVAGLITGVVSFAVAGSQASELERDIEAYNALPDGERTTTGFENLDGRDRSVGRLDTLTVSAGVIGIVAAAAGSAVLLIGPEPGRYDLWVSPAGVAGRF